MTAVLHDYCFRSSTGLVPFETARRAAVALVQPLGQLEDVSLDAAGGRILAAAIEAPRALPPFDQAAMDGYALSMSGRRGLPLVLPVAGRTRAGDPRGVLTPGTAHRIMTGAALPSGADTVVMQEQVTRRGNLVQFGLEIESGTHIRKAGEDVGRGSIILQAGRMIGWPEIALLAALGVNTISVFRTLRIAVLATGSELRDAGERLSSGAICNSNGPMLAALLAAPSVQVTSLTVGDDVDAIAHALESVAGSVDLLITTAGMSVGEEDHVRDAVIHAGGQLEIVKVAMKPGKPLALGKVKDTCFVGLPGNPQAAAFGALAFVRPMITALLGGKPASRLTAEVDFPCRCKPDRTELLPVRLGVKHGRLIARRSGGDGSHRMMPMVSADAVAIIPGVSTVIEAGASLEVLPFDRLRFGE